LLIIGVAALGQTRAQGREKSTLVGRGVWVASPALGKVEADLLGKAVHRKARGDRALL